MNKPDDYVSQVNHLKNRIREFQNSASPILNKELLSQYWEIGSVVLFQQKTQGWGSNVIGRLSEDLKTEFPDFKGLSVRNLKYMRDFAAAFPDFGQQAASQIEHIEYQFNVILQQLVAKIPWGHLTVLLDRFKKKEERFFYILKTAKNGWSRDFMLRNIESKLFENEESVITNLYSTLTSAQADSAQQAFKSQYNTDFDAFRNGIENELGRGETTVDEKLDMIEDILSKLTTEGVKRKVDKGVIDYTIESVIEPVILGFEKKMKPVKALFNELIIDYYLDENGSLLGSNTCKGLTQEIRYHAEMFRSLRITFQFGGFKYVGANSFDMNFSIHVFFDSYKYQFMLKESSVFNKLYDTSLNQKEFDKLVNVYSDKLLNQLEAIVNNLKDEGVSLPWEEFIPK